MKNKIILNWMQNLDRLTASQAQMILGGYYLTTGRHYPLIAGNSTLLPTNSRHYPITTSVMAANCYLDVLRRMPTFIGCLPLSDVYLINTCFTGRLRIRYKHLIKHMHSHTARYNMRLSDA